MELCFSKSVAIFHKVSWNGYSLVANFVENIGSFNQLKIIGLDQVFLIRSNKRNKIEAVIQQLQQINPRIYIYEQKRNRYTYR